MPATASSDANLIEVFSSIQGEGLLVGCRQVFVRFSGCNLQCSYCDTPFEAVSQCMVEEVPGSGKLTPVPNPVSLKTLTAIVRRWEENRSGMHHSLSLTGGEPLVHGDLLSRWIPELRRILPVYLETNGTLPEALERLVEEIDWISMDLKLESVTAEPTPWDIHRDFLEIARRKNCYVKAVVGAQTPLEEVEQAARLVHGCAEDCALVLQPVTLNDAVGLGAARLLELQAAAAAFHPHTRVIPQTHRFIHLL